MSTMTCVSDAHQWCVVRNQKLSVKNLGDMAIVLTRCGRAVVGHYGVERRAPSCPRCRAELKKRKQPRK